MGKKTGGMSREAMVLRAAFDQSKMKQAAIAQHMGVTPGMVWQWLNDRTPVAADKAARLGQLLSVDPAGISADYARVAANEPGNVVPLPKLADAPSDQRRQDLVLARLENDVTALSYALSGLVVAMVSHRPTEAVDAARVIRKTVPAKYRERGLVQELLVTLDKAAKA